MFSLSLFGAPVLDGADGPVTGPAAQRQRLALLALLSTAPGHRLSRDKLLAYLWPESDTDRARQLLNVSVHALRKGLGEETLLSAGDELTLNAESVQSDVAAFEEALERGEAGRAVELYTAPFLDGFYLSGSTEFEHWVDTERARLASLYERALESLATDAQAGGDAETAVAWWRQLSARNPYSGHVAAGVMRALEAAGDHAGAIQHAATHEKLLKEKIGAQPDPEVVALAQRLREQPSGEFGFSDAALILGARAERADAAGGEPSKANNRWLFWTVGSAAALLLLVAVISVDGLLSPDPEASEPAAPAGLVLESNRVLVLPFANQTGDPELDRLGAMAADWITRGLAETGMVRAVPAMGIEPTEALDALGSPAEAARSMAEATRAAIAVFGSFYRQGDSLAFEARITDVATGELLRAIGGISVPVQASVEAAEILRQRTTGALATVLDPMLESWATAASQPPSYEAYELYAEGLQVFFRSSEGRVEKFRRAAEFFHRAAELDSSFVVPLLWALYAHGNAGDFTRRDSLAQALDERRDRLTLWERALLDAHLAVSRGDSQGEYRAYSRVVEMAPGSEWNYKLASAAYRLNRPQEAVDLLSQVNPAHGWLGNWELYWGLLARSRHWLGQHEQELRDAQRGRVQLPESGSLPMHEMRAIGALGRVELAASQYVEEYLETLVDELLAHGHKAAATQLIADHLAQYDPDQDSLVGRSVYWLERAGRLAEAEVLLEGVLEAEPNQWESWGWLGILADKRGDRQKAIRISSRLEESRHERAVFRARATYYRALIAAHLGDNEGALRLLRRVREEGPFDTHDLHASWHVPEALRDYPPFKEFMRPKG
jgi:DNA-binding SARP family transcriptional activator/Tfp pilus assembly protein PilF/TolB-like protein